MTANFQVSGKDQAGRIFVVGGENYAEFVNNLAVLADEDPTEVVNGLAAIIGVTRGNDGGFAGAQRAAQQGLGATPAYPQQPAQRDEPQGYQQDPYYGQSQPAYEQPRAAAPPPGGPGPSCVHGPKKWVEGGVSKKTGRPYQGFYACPAPQGQQCAR